MTADLMPAIRAAIADFPFDGYGIDLDGADPAWVGDLAAAITGALPAVGAAEPAVVEARFADRNGDEWVSCSRSHCPNAERYEKATERGWQHGHMGTWQCPQHADATYGTTRGEPGDEEGAGPETPAQRATREIQALHDPAVIGYVTGLNTLTLTLRPYTWQEWQTWQKRLNCPIGQTTYRGGSATAHGMWGHIPVHVHCVLDRLPKATEPGDGA